MLCIYKIRFIKVVKNFKQKQKKHLTRLTESGAIIYFEISLFKRFQSREISGVA